MPTQRKRRTQEVYNELLILANIQIRSTKGKNISENGVLVTTSYKQLKLRLKLKKWMIKQYLIELEELKYIDRDYKNINDEHDKYHNRLHIYLLKINEKLP